MADRDFDPKQGGFTRIMNELLDKLIGYGLDRNEWKLVILVIRRTWGIRGQAWAVIKWDYMLKKTKLGHSGLGYARAKLKARNILHTETAKHVTSYKINSKVSTWIPEEDLPTDLYHIRKDLLQPVGEDSYSNPLEKVLQPVGETNSNPLEKQLQPVGVAPFKERLLKKDSFKDKLNTSVCGSPSNIEILTPKEQLEEDAKSVLNCLNDLSGKEFSYDEENLKPIIERMDNGATIDDCFKVCFNKWGDHTFQNQYYRPSTLFKKALFEGYLNSTGTKFKPASQADARRYKTAETLYRRRNERKKARQNDQGGGD
jgi:uncharacterized phage protein (TIGR02220 family)